MTQRTSNSTTAQRPAWLDESLFPFQSRYLDVHGCRVHYIDEGSGPVLLMLHGNPTWSFLYRGIIKGLQDRFRCVALDYPGFGLSTASRGYGYTPAEHATVVEKFLLALNLSGVTMMGQDWGGPIGLHVVSHHPERFRALILGNTFAWPVNGIPEFERFSRLMGGPLGGFFIRNFNAFVNILMPLGVNRGKLPKRVMAAYRAPFSKRSSRRPMHVFPREILASRSFLTEVENGLARLKQLPVLIVWGNRDIAFRKRELNRFEQLFPKSRTVILQGAGHYIQEDAPEEIVSAIAEWWPSI